MSEKTCVIFTDLKDFTYKNALLTDTQVQEILDNFQRIVKASAQLHNVELVKSIGDAYFAISESPYNAYAFSQELIQKSLEYDAYQKISLKKISLRVTLTYGHITKNRNLEATDYFGDAINLASRMMEITPSGKIFCTENFFESIKGSVQAKSVGNFSFHGLLETVNILSLNEISHQELTMIHSQHSSRLSECEDIIFKSSCVAAVLSIQPLPFLENFNLVAVHLYMIMRISAKFDATLSLKESSKIFGELIAPLGLSYAAFQGSATAIKILLPGFGGYLFAPVSFAVSYALGKIYVVYFSYAESGEKLSAETMKDLFQKHKKEGKRLAKEKKKSIFQIGKKYSEEVMHIGKKQDFQQVQSDTIRMLKQK